MPSAYARCLHGMSHLECAMLRGVRQAVRHAAQVAKREEAAEAAKAVEEELGTLRERSDALKRFEEDRLRLIEMIEKQLGLDIPEPVDPKAKKK